MPPEPVVQIPAFAASKENVSITGGLGGSDVNLCDREKQFHVCAMANCRELFPAWTWCCQLHFIARMVRASESMAM
jgi:hypothetical protein